MWPSPSKGFTHVELLVALGVVAIASAAGFTALRQHTETYKQMAFQIETESNEKVLTALMRNDIRRATLRDENFSFSGDRHKINFVRTGDRPGFFWEVGYRWAPDASTQMAPVFRRVQDNVDGNGRDGGSETPVTSNEPLFELSYFDGSAWLETWGWSQENGRLSKGIRGLPWAVRVRTTNGETIFPVMVSVLNASCERREGGSVL